MLPLVVIGFQSRHGGTKLTLVIVKGKRLHMLVPHQGGQFNIRRSWLSRGARARVRFWLYPMHWPFTQSLRQSRRHFLQRVVTEIALRGQPRQSLRQAQFVLSRRQVPDLQRQIFCGSRSNVVGESAQPVNLVGDRLFVRAPDHFLLMLCLADEWCESRDCSQHCCGQDKDKAHPSKRSTGCHSHQA